MADYVHNLGVLCSEAPRNDMVILPSVLPSAPPPPPPPNALGLSQNEHAGQLRQHGIEALLSGLSLSSMQRLGQAVAPNPLGPPGQLGAVGMGQHVLPSQTGVGGFPGAPQQGFLMANGYGQPGMSLGGLQGGHSLPNPGPLQGGLGGYGGALGGGLQPGAARLGFGGAGQGYGQPGALQRGQYAPGVGGGLNPNALNPNPLLGMGAQPNGRPLPAGRSARFKAPNPSSNQFKLGPSLGTLAGGQVGGAPNPNPMGFGAPPGPGAYERFGGVAPAPAPPPLRRGPPPAPPRPGQGMNLNLNPSGFLGGQAPAPPYQQAYPGAGFRSGMGVGGPYGAGAGYPAPHPQEQWRGVGGVAPPPPARNSPSPGAYNPGQGFMRGLLGTGGAQGQGQGQGQGLASHGIGAQGLAGQGFGGAVHAQLGAYGAVQGLGTGYGAPPPAIPPLSALQAQSNHTSPANPGYSAALQAPQAAVQGLFFNGNAGQAATGGGGGGMFSAPPAPHPSSALASARFGAAPLPASAGLGAAPALAGQPPLSSAGLGLGLGQQLSASGGFGPTSAGPQPGSSVALALGALGASSSGGDAFGGQSGAQGAGYGQGLDAQAPARGAFELAGWPAGPSNPNPAVGAAAGLYGGRASPSAAQGQAGGAGLFAAAGQALGAPPSQAPGGPLSGLASKAPGEPLGGSLGGLDPPVPRPGSALGGAGSFVQGSDHTLGSSQSQGSGQASPGSAGLASSASYSLFRAPSQRLGAAFATGLSPMERADSAPGWAQGPGSAGSGSEVRCQH